MNEKTPAHPLAFLERQLKYRALLSPSFRATMKDTAPLTGQENAVYESVAAYYENALARRKGLAPQEARLQVRAALSNYSKKAIVRLYIEPPLFWGLFPTRWFMAMSWVYMAFYIMTIFTKNTDLEMLATSCLTLTLTIATVYYQFNRKRIKQRKIEKILTQGIA